MTNLLNIFISSIRKTFNEMNIGDMFWNGVIYFEKISTTEYIEFPKEYPKSNITYEKDKFKKYIYPNTFNYITYNTVIKYSGKKLDRYKYKEDSNDKLINPL